MSTESAIDSISRMREDLAGRWIGDGQAAQARLLGSANIVNIQDSPLSKLEKVESFSDRCIKESRFFSIHPLFLEGLIKSIPVDSDFLTYHETIRKKLRLNLLARMHPDQTGKSSELFKLASHRIDELSADIALGAFKARSRVKRYSRVAWVRVGNCWNRPYPENLQFDEPVQERRLITYQKMQ